MIPDYIIINRKDLTYVRRLVLGDLDKDRYTMFFDDDGSCKKLTNRLLQTIKSEAVLFAV